MSIDTSSTIFIIVAISYIFPCHALSTTTLQWTQGFCQWNIYSMFRCFITSERRCLVIESWSEFESWLVNIMVRPVKRMHVSDELMCELLQECSDTSDSEISGDMNFFK
jgi:hypothetical protein